MTKQDVYAEVTDRIIAALEQGTVPWRKPWRTAAYGGPVSLSTGRPYRGINVFLLELQGYSDPRWGTYKAISELGGQVRKGEKGTRVILWKPARRTVEDASTGETEQRAYLLLRTFTVFNAEQADGLPELPAVEDVSPFTADERAEAIVKGWGGKPGIVHGRSQAAYSPAKDMVYMPNPEDFVGTDEYYTTLFHELTHATGHESRLNRLEPALFGTDPYAREELVAELGASMLAGLAGLAVAGGEQSAAYIASWLKRLKDDPKLIVNAAAQAQKAADMIVGTTFDQADVPEMAAAA